MAVRISQVSFEHHRIALGIGEPNPRISWQFEGNWPNWTQGGYSIEIARDGEIQPQLFHFNSSESVLVPWPTASLASAESASIRVKAHGEDDHPDTPWSQIVNVETGLLNPVDWSDALMMAADKETEKDQPHQPVLFRKEFRVHGVAQKARLYITAYGLYETFINGQRVGDLVLAPGWQSYKHRLVYDTYDVTDFLRDGENVIGVQVGEGWYAGRLGFNGGSRNLWGDTLGALALLTFTGPDGTREVVRTDKTWSASTGAIITSELYDGETYDSRLEQPGWAAAGFEALETTKWAGVKELNGPSGQLAAPDGPPIRRIEVVQLKEVINSPSGKTILDFGQNLVGWLKLHVAGPEGQTIKLVHTEVLENGEVAIRPLRNATQTDYFTLSGTGVQVWEPTFTYHGFRYVMVEDWPIDDTPLDRDAVIAIVVHSDMQETGSFECSNELLNKLHQNVQWSMKGNFMSIPTDCPQRDERLGWTGDAHAFSPTANFLYDTSGFWRSWMKDVQSEQLQNEGVPPVAVPAVPAIGPRMPAAIWGDVAVVNPWNTYTAFGDLDVLREQYPGAKAWLDSGIPRNEAGLWNRSSDQFGDWLDPLAPSDSPGNATTNPLYVADAYLVYITDLMAKIASELGLENEVSRYNTWATDLKAAFIDAWVSLNGTVANETQTGLALPLYFDLFKDEAQSNEAAQRLQKIIEANKNLIGTGFAGTHLLGLTLSKYNLTETFYNMILQTTVPSWLYQVEMGATTTWERWDSLLPDGSLNPGEMTSFNHYAVGSVANWIHQVVGGLGPAEPRWKEIKVNVVPGGNVTEARASHLSPYGKVATHWRVDNHGFRLSLEVPPNARAVVTLPGNNGQGEVVGSGSYEFSVPEFRL